MHSLGPSFPKAGSGPLLVLSLSSVSPICRQCHGSAQQSELFGPETEKWSQGTKKYQRDHGEEGTWQSNVIKVVLFLYIIFWLLLNLYIHESDLY